MVDLYNRPHKGPEWFWEVFKGSIMDNAKQISLGDAVVLLVSLYNSLGNNPMKNTLY